MTEGQDFTKVGQWAAKKECEFAVEVVVDEEAQLCPISTADMYTDMQS